MPYRIVISLLFILIFGCRNEEKTSQPPGDPRPNILFLFADDQRYSTLHALGNDQIITPNLDRLTNAGTAFRNAYIMGSYSGAVCRPSRAMLMTGRNVFGLENQGKTIPGEHSLMGETLKENGYNCFGTGKWHNGREAFNRCFNQGKDIFFGGMNDHWNTPLYDFDSTGNYPNSRFKVVNPCCTNELDTLMGDHLHSGVHSTDIFSDAVIEYLDRYDSPDPFFVYCSYMAPHDPRTMPKKYRDMYDTASISLPPNFLPEHPFDNGELVIRDEKLAEIPRIPSEIKMHLRDYYAMITHLDDRIGDILQKIEENGQLDNTIIIFSGDNGLAVGQHGLMGKQNLYEHSIKVPLIFSGPGVPQGDLRDQSVYLYDIYPTICEQLNIVPPPSIQGKSFQLAIGSPAHSTRNSMYFVYKDYQRALREDQYKLIRYQVEGKQTTQLFNLESDPWEMNNLAGQVAYQGMIAEMTSKMKDAAVASDDTTRWVRK